jgi:peptide/nickel transport system substrate-binding protein
LGYEARLEVPPDQDYDEYIHSPQQRAQLVMTGWVPDYPAASSFLEGLFSCHGGGNPRRFCEPGVEAKIARAVVLQQSQPAAAGRLWQLADRAVVDRAAVLPLGFFLDASVTSPRVGNYLHQPGQSGLVDQLWVKP